MALMRIFVYPERADTHSRRTDDGSDCSCRCRRRQSERPPPSRSPPAKCRPADRNRRYRRRHRRIPADRCRPTCNTSMWPADAAAATPPICNCSGPACPIANGDGAGSAVATVGVAKLSAKRRTSRWACRWADGAAAADGCACPMRWCRQGCRYCCRCRRPDRIRTDVSCRLCRARA